MAKGCDYSFSRPSITALKNAGYKFACRYVGGSAGKRITAIEARNLWANGIDIVTNFEQFPTQPLQGRAQGIADAKLADAQHKAAGGPPNAPIYFSADFDVQPHQMGAVAAYIAGCSSWLGSSRTGVYGGLGVVKWMADNAVCHYFWQTYAWSHGRWDARAHIQQYQNGVNIGGGQIDLDRSMHPDFGAWHGPQGNQTLVPVTAGAWDPLPGMYAVTGHLWDLARNLNRYAASIKSIRK
jgi:hypothetical protein